MSVMDKVQVNLETQHTAPLPTENKALSLDSSNEVQDALPAKRAPWHIKYLKLKDFFVFNSRSRKVTLTSSATRFSFFPEMSHKIPRESYPFCTMRREDIFIIRNREFGAKNSVRTNIVKLTVIFPVTSSSFTTPSPNPFILSTLHTFVSLPKMYKTIFLKNLPNW